MQQRLSQLIAVLLHPLFMPLYGTWILLHSGSYLSYTTSPILQRFIYLIVFVSTYLLPALSAWLLWQKGWIGSMEMKERKERSVPFLAALVCYTAGIYLLFKLPVPRLFGIMVGGGALAIFWAFLVNLRWKISIHMIGIGGLMGLMYGYARYFHVSMIWPLAILAILSGLLGTARLIREAHSPAQIYTGFVGGFLIEFVYIWYIVNEILAN